MRRESTRAVPRAGGAEAGDAVARELLRETADLAAVWLGNMIDVFDPK